MQKVVALGNPDKGLYFLQQDCQFSTTTTDTLPCSLLLKKKTEDSVIACFSDSELQHFRLDHLSFEQLKYVDIDTCNNTRHHGVCQICPMAKMHISGFPLSNSRAKNYVLT